MQSCILYIYLNHPSTQSIHKTQSLKIANTENISGMLLRRKEEANRM